MNLDELVQLELEFVLDLMYIDFRRIPKKRSDPEVLRKVGQICADHGLDDCSADWHALADKAQEFLDFVDMNPQKVIDVVQGLEALGALSRSYNRLTPLGERLDLSYIERNPSGKYTALNNGVLRAIPPFRETEQFARVFLNCRSDLLDDQERYSVLKGLAERSVDLAAKYSRSMFHQKKPSFDDLSAATRLAKKLCFYKDRARFCPVAIKAGEMNPADLNYVGTSVDGLLNFAKECGAPSDILALYDRIIQFGPLWRGDLEVLRRSDRILEAITYAKEHGENALVLKWAKVGYEQCDGARDYARGKRIADAAGQSAKALKYHNAAKPVA